MKKFFLLLLVPVMFFALVGTISARAYEVKVFVDGEQVHFDQLPLIENGRTLVPVRAIAEKLGASVDWNKDTRIATVTKGNDVVVMTIDSNIVSKNGFKFEIDQPAVIRGDRTLIPARALAESLDCRVDWDQEAYRADITKVEDECFDALEAFMEEKGIKTDNAYFLSCPAEVLVNSSEYKGMSVDVIFFAATNTVQMKYVYSKDGKGGAITFCRGADDFEFSATEKFICEETLKKLSRKDVSFTMPQNLALTTDSIAKGYGITQKEAETIATESLETALMMSDTLLVRLGAPVTLRDLGFVNCEAK